MSSTRRAIKYATARTAARIRNQQLANVWTHCAAILIITATLAATLAVLLITAIGIMHYGF